MKVRFSFDAGSYSIEEMQTFPRGTSDQEIDDTFADWQSNIVQSGWSRVKPRPEPTPRPKSKTYVLTSGKQK